MPTKTFFNLADEKQNRIIEAAKDEFLKYSFYDASINRMIKDADISRGAFYMYFKNKEDLFLYLMESYKDRILKDMTKDIPKRQYDLFEFGVLVFDYVTSEKINNEYKEILNILLTKIDVHLINHCINSQDDTIKIKTIKSYINTENLCINSEKELIDLAEFIFTAVIMEIIYVSAGKYKIEQSKENLERKFNVIKYGVIK